MPVNPDIQKERDKCLFNPTELTNYLDGGEVKTKERRAREDFIIYDPDLQDKIPYDYLSHKEKYEESVRKTCVLVRKIRELRQKKNDSGVDELQTIISSILETSMSPDGSLAAIHYVMFIKSIMAHGSSEQQAKWLERAWNFEIAGTYAQTEMGHGTFVRGLETTATYDEQAREFILDSPTITSQKWWPGGLGHFVNYAIIAAQLLTRGKCHGVHLFLVQLRNEDTHLPLPGIKLGEIGAKFGLNSANNGYLAFDKIRIPRNHMLMKNQQVLEDGTYVKPQSSVLTYASMNFTRVVIVKDMGNLISKAATIAVRYSAVRRQSELKSNTIEPQIMDYVTQQHKLYPAIATSFAFRFSAGFLTDFYNDIIRSVDAGDLNMLPELHALACGLKAVCSTEAARSVELCRLACGGHGYMSCSSLSTIYGLATAAITYEGENTVMHLQTARYLMKVNQLAIKGDAVTPSVQYLSDIGTEVKWNSSVPGIIDGFQRVAQGKVRDCAKTLDQLVKKGISYEDAWNMTSIQLVEASKAHCNNFILSTYWRETNRIFAKASKELRTVMNTLMELYAVHVALEARGDLALYTKINADDVLSLQRREEVLLAKIRPNAVGVVDGFDYRDEILASALGAFDGRVYERLMEEAAKSPLNAEPVNQSFHLHLKSRVRRSKI